MAFEAEALGFHAADVKLGKNLLGGVSLVGGQERGVMVGQLQGLDHRRVALRAVLRALDLGGINVVEIGTCRHQPVGRRP